MVTSVAVVRWEQVTVCGVVQYGGRQCCVQPVMPDVYRVALPLGRPFVPPAMAESLNLNPSC
jgi:hypothetical protein